MSLILYIILEKTNSYYFHASHYQFKISLHKGYFTVHKTFMVIWFSPVVHGKKKKSEWEVEKREQNVEIHFILWLSQPVKVMVASELPVS